MYDLWAFLLQTLTASGVAVLLLIVKALFRDKLPPRWHFAIWGILGIVLVIPAGLGGRYVLFRWPLAVETLRAMLAGEYTFTRVLFPFPVLLSKPETIFEWLFAVYFAGVIFHLAKYAFAYLRLRSVLRRGWAADADLMERISRIAADNKVKIKKVVTVPGLPSAFVCGIFRPVLALPDNAVDEKILLHELLHLKQRDTVWSIVICVLRSIHWCNPLLVCCAKRAGNDLEARCDQRVLEKLEGEDRRDYGKMLLAMTNDRFARTPGATCVNNGGKSIRRRIEAIARFKRYPRGMELVAVCAAIVLALPMFLGVEATAVYELNHPTSAELAFASARTTPCTTAAGAFDAYGKAILDQNGVYRAMCAPEAIQKELAQTVTERYEGGGYPYWDTGLDSWATAQEGYHLYNLREISDTACEALLVIGLNYRPDGTETEYGRMVLAYQNIRAEKEGHRWVVIPLAQWEWMETTHGSLGWGLTELPAYVYSDTYEDLRVEIRMQTIHVIDNTITQQDDMSFLFGPTTSYDIVPKPNAEFDSVRYADMTVCTHLGTQEERDQINRLGVSSLRVQQDEERPHLTVPQGDWSSGSSTNGSAWCSRSLSDGWGPVQGMGGSGSSGHPDEIYSFFPAGFAVDLYINGEKSAELMLTLEEGCPR